MSNIDLNTVLDTYREAFAPVVRVQQEGIKTIERLARYQFSVAGDYLDWTFAHAKAAVNAKSPSELLGQQTELNTRLGDKLRARAHEFAQIATDTSGAVTQWFDETTAKVVEKAKKAA